MRFIITIFLLLSIVTLTACQDRKDEQDPKTAAVVETAEEAEQPPETAGQPADEESGAAVIKGQGNEEVFDLTREDAQALLNGRFLLTTFMNQTEGIPVPLADQWKLEKVEGGEGDGRVFTFSSEEWTLLLREPGASASGILYHAEISGPDLPRYAGDVLADGSVSPLQ